MANQEEMKVLPGLLDTRQVLTTPMMEGITSIYLEGQMVLPNLDPTRGSHRFGQLALDGILTKSHLWKILPPLTD